MSEPTPLEYQVFGVLCAAKLETGPDGARRMYRIQERINVWDDEAMIGALRSLMDRGWVRQMEQVVQGMVHFEAIVRADNKYSVKLDQD